MKRAFIAIILCAISLSVGCQSNLGRGCAGGQCGLLGGGCQDNSCDGGSFVNESCGAGCATVHGQDLSGANANYAPFNGRGGPLGGLIGRHHRGPQSHMRSAPGPAQGPAAPTYGYPYYTTRGPRDFLNPNPPSIGR